MRTIDAHGTSFEAALTNALADVLGCDTDKVEVRVEAPGLTDLRGPLRLDLDVRTTPDSEQGPVDDEVPEDEMPEDDDVLEIDDSDAGADAHETEEDLEEDDRAGAIGDERVQATRRGEAVSVEELDEEAEAAADFMEGLLDALELPGDLRIKVHEDHAEVEVLEVGSGALIGRRGQTLEAIQELARCALQREFQRRSRVKIDAEGYRARRLEKLLEKAEEVVDDVLATGESQRLEPMDVFERKAVHHLVADRGGVTSRSQGREPARRVIIERE